MGEGGRAVRVACILAALLVCAVCDYEAVRTSPINADNVQSFIDMQAIAAGNWRLQGWWVVSDNYVFTDALLYRLLSFVFGVRTELLIIEPWVVRLLFMGGCVALVRQMGRDAPARDFATLAVLLLLGLPLSAAQAPLFHASEHAATIAFAVAGFALAARLFERLIWWRLATLAVMAAAMAAADPQGDFYFAAPFAAVFLLRLWLHPGWRAAEMALLICLAGGLAAGMALPGWVSGQGGFTVVRDFSISFVSGPDVLWVAAAHFAWMVRAGFGGVAYMVPGGGWVAGVRLLLLAACLAGCAWIFWAAPRRRDGGLAQWLVGAALMFALADCVSGFYAAQWYASRYVLPEVVLIGLAGAVVAAQAWPALGRRAQAAAWLVLALAWGVQAAAAVGQAAAAARAPAFIRSDAATGAQAARWLAGQHFTYGVGDYWSAGMVTALTNGAVHVEAMHEAAPGAALVAYCWTGDERGVLGGRRPQFVVFLASPLDPLSRVTLAEVTAAFGAPVAVRQFGPDIVAVLKG
jgi:hypothetical protein